MWAAPRADQLGCDGVADLGLGHIRCSVDGRRIMPGRAGSYSAPGGHVQLRAQVAELHGIAPACVTLTTGASMGLVAALATLPRPGTVLCPRPHYPAYPHMIEAVGLTPTYYDLPETSAWIPELTDVAQRIASDTRAILWNAPSNPTGALPTTAFHRALLHLSTDRDLVLITDEVYAGIAYEQDEPDPCGALDPNQCLRIRSFSKLLCIPGERLGYVVGPAEHVARIQRAHWHLAMCPPRHAQTLVEGLLQEDLAAHLGALRVTLKRHRDTACALLDSQALVAFRKPTAGIFLWVSVPFWSGADRLARKLREHGVLVMPGTAFGVRDPTYIRLSFAVPEATLRQGIATLGRVLTGAMSDGAHRSGEE